MRVLDLLAFPTPANSNVVCNFGAVIVFLITIEFFSGLMLSFRMFLDNSGIISKLNILNNSLIGWSVFKFHCVSPYLISFFIVSHIFKSFFSFINSSYTVIITGFFLILFFIGVSYTGYSLSRGSMGYWAVVVVNGLMKEGIGSRLSSSLFFHSSLGPGLETFFKIFTYHFLLSFLIILLQFVHIFFLHTTGSSNFISSFYLDYFRFSFSMFYKDLFLFLLVILSFLYFIFYSFFKLSGENFLEIDEFKALDLSVEWYVRVFFIILRGVSFKLLGIFFTLVFLLAIVLSFFIKDLFRLDNVITYNFYTVLFIFNIFFVYLAYLGFSSFIFLTSFVLLILLYFLLDAFFIKFYFKCY